MATKTTGRAASRVRNDARKAKLKSAPTGVVAGASTSGPSTALKNLSINLVNGGGSARGDDFAGGYTPGADTSEVSTTPRSKEELQNATFRLAGGGSSGISASAQRAAELQRLRDERNDRKDRRKKLSEGGLLASDNLRASNIDTVGGEAVTNKGARSSVSGRDETKRTGAGTFENPLTDIQIQDLLDQGIKEGDEVPGKGFLTPLGTFQSKYERQAEQLNKAATDLASKDTAPTDGIVGSDETIVMDEKQATDAINNASLVERDLTYIDDEITRLQDDLKSEIEAINAQAKIDKENKIGEQASETGQTSVGLANAGGYLGFSGSATGVLLNLAKSHRSELQSLDNDRKQLIFEAQDAARKGQYDLVKLKAQELKDIEQEEYNRKQDYYNRNKAINDKETAKKEEVATQNSIFSAIQMGAKTPEAIFSALGGEVDIAQISKFLNSIDAGDDTGFKFSATNNASLLGAGMSMKDINTLKEHINENGYNEEIRSALTSTQRMAVDKIFLPKPTGPAVDPNSKYTVEIKGATLNKISGLGYLPEEISDIEYVLNNFGIESVLAGEDDPDKRAQLAEILGGDTALGTVERSLNPPTVEETITDIIGSMSGEQITKLKTKADQAGISSMWKGKKTDIENMLKAPEMQEQLQIAIDNGLTTEEILQALTE